MAAPSRSTVLEEIVVTADKRQQSVRDIAGSVTGINGKQMEEAGASGLGEYLSLSPGVNFSSSVPGQSLITIRGISSDTVPGFTQTTVGVYYDDIPLTDPSAPIVVPDIDAFDADRVEVLRGPQGALYGSASMGGAMNYVPNQPNFSDYEFSVMGTGNIMENSSVGGSFKMMVNTPFFQDSEIFDDGLALRVAGHITHQPGYIDNLGLDRPQSNETTTGGGRAMVSWAPTGNSVLRLGGLYQRTFVPDQGYTLDTLDDLQKSSIMPEETFNQFWLSSLHYEISEDYGTWSLIGGYQEKDSLVSFDASSGLGLDQTGLQIPLVQGGSVQGYSAELRFVSPLDDTFYWLAGISYVDRKELFYDSLTPELTSTTVAIATNLLGALGIPVPADIEAVGTLFSQTANVKAPEKAAYLEGTFAFLDRFKLTAGGRFYDNMVESSTVSSGVLMLPTGSLSATAYDKQVGQGFNPKVSISMEVTDDVMVYALYSRGYRLGGVNLSPVTPLTNASQFYSADEVRNFELGAKTRWFSGAMTADVTAYRIDWKDIPLLIQDSAGLFNYLENAGNAKVDGVEAALAIMPFDFLTARSSVTYNDARLLNDFDPDNGQPPAMAGDQLPGAPKLTVTNLLSGVWYVGNSIPSVTLIHRYVGESPSNLSFKDIPVGGYHLFDLRAGTKLNGWSITAFVKNIGDERAITASKNQPRPNGDIVSARYIIPPRSIGLEFGYTYGQ